MHFSHTIGEDFLDLRTLVLTVSGPRVETTPSSAEFSSTRPPQMSHIITRGMGLVRVVEEILEKKLGLFIFVLDTITIFRDRSCNPYVCV